MSRFDRKRSSRPRRQTTITSVGRGLRMEPLEDRRLLNGTMAFDFGTPTSPVATGTVGVSTESYTPQRGYGWSGGGLLDSRDRGQPDSVTRDFVFGDASGATFLVDLPDGSYQVRPTIGDAATGHDQIGLWAQGQQIESGLSVAAGQFATPSYHVQVSGGQLALRMADLGGTNNNWVLDAVSITPESIKPAPSAFDFGTPTSPVATGTVGVSTESYMPQRGYGWSGGGLLDSRDRGQPDSVTRDFVFGDASGATFLVDLPDGSYQVRPTIGDAATGHDQIGLWAQGQQIESSLSVAAGQFATPSYHVQVSGGQLALRIADLGGTNNNWVLDALTILPEAVGSNGSLDAGGPYIAQEGSPITLTATGTGTSAQGASFAWDLNDDGTYETTGQMVSESFPDNGVYKIGVQMTDLLGGVQTVTTIVTVSNVAPTALPGGPYSVTVNQPLSFAGSATDPGQADMAAGFTYQWNFGDGTGGTGANPSHTYANEGTYTATLVAMDKDGGSSAVATSTVVVKSATTSMEMDMQIPDFSQGMTIKSVANGAWSDPATWSEGRVPTSGDVVVIGKGTTVNFDVVSNDRLKSVVVADGGVLHFRTDSNTRMLVGTLEVMLGGTLEVGTSANPVASGVKADIVIADQPIDTTLDPQQFGTGLVGMGRVSLHGSSMTSTYVRLATQPRTGDTTLSLSESVSGWRPGDRLILPDTRQNQDGDSKNNPTQLEELTLASVSPDGKTLYLTAPLKYDHLGAAVDGVVAPDFMPHVGDLTRNVTISSENSQGTRGHTLFEMRADVDIEYVAFRDLGRTQNAPLDNTTFDDMGNVTHIGTNENSRYPLHMHHLSGPSTPQPDGYQYTLIGNAIDGGSTTSNFKWGITIHASHYGLIQDNVVYNVAGSGIVTENGSETHNRIEGNFIVRVSGIGSDRADEDNGLYGVAHEGGGIWLHGPDNYVDNNVVADVRMYGYTIALVFGNPHTEESPIPTAPGQLPSQYQTVNMNYTPLREFAGNEVYASMDGLTVWNLGVTFGNDTTYDNGAPNVISDLHIWHVAYKGIYFYPNNRVVLDGLVIREDVSDLAAGYYGTIGIYNSDYYSRGLVIRNADLQGLNIGVQFPLSVNGGKDLILENSYLRNYRNVQVETMYSQNVDDDTYIQPRRIIIQDVLFATPNVTIHSDDPPPLDIDMDYHPDHMSANVIQSDEVFVYNYNRVPGDNFRVYYEEQAAGFILPATEYNSSGHMNLRGAPVPGLTNQQTWDQYGIALAGAVAPSDTTTMPKIRGLIEAITNNAGASIGAGPLDAIGSSLTASRRDGGGWPLGSVWFDVSRLQTTDGRQHRSTDCCHRSRRQGVDRSAVGIVGGSRQSCNWCFHEAAEEPRSDLILLSRGRGGGSARVRFTGPAGPCFRWISVRPGSTIHRRTRDGLGQLDAYPRSIRKRLPGP